MLFVDLTIQRKRPTPLQCKKALQQPPQNLFVYFSFHKLAACHLSFAAFNHYAHIRTTLLLLLAIYTPSSGLPTAYFATMR